MCLLWFLIDYPWTHESYWCPVGTNSRSPVFQGRSCYIKNITIFNEASSFRKSFEMCCDELTTTKHWVVVPLLQGFDRRRALEQLDHRVDVAAVPAICPLRQVWFLFCKRDRWSFQWFVGRPRCSHVFIYSWCSDILVISHVSSSERTIEYSSTLSVFMLHNDNHIRKKKCFIC